MNRSLRIALSIIVLIVIAVGVGLIYYQANPEEWEAFVAEMSGDESTRPKPNEQKSEERDAEGMQASGSIEVEEISIASLSGGRVTKVLADEGQTVSEGDLLAVLDSSAIENSRLGLLAAVSQAEAAVEMAEAQLAQAESGPRSEEIAAAEGAVQSAMAQVDLANAGVDAVESALALAVEGPSD